MRYRDVTRRLRALGCEEVPRHGVGSHRIWRNPVSGKVTPVPDWGSRDLKMGTLRHIVRQLGLEWEGFKQA